MPIPYRRLFEAAPFPMWVFELKTLKILEANPAAAAAFGRARAELLRCTMLDLRPPEEIPVMRRRLSEPVRWNTLYHVRYRRRDGRLFHASAWGTPIRLGKRRAALVTARDLATGDPTQRALVESEERFRLMVQNVRDYAIFMLEADGTVATWNVGAQRIKGYRPEEIIGKSWQVFYPPADRRAGLPRRLLARAAREGSADHTGFRVRKDGTRFLAHVVITALRGPDGKLRGFAKVTRDLSERESAREKAGFSKRLLEAAESERRRVARELHDGVNQMLASSLLRLRTAESLAEAGSTGARASLAEGRRIVEDSIAEIRRISSDLRPAVLEDLGLCAAIRSLCRRAISPEGRPVELKACRLAHRLDADVELAAYRIVQEAVANALRHSGACRIVVAVTHARGRLRLSVSDDGRGFSPRRARREGSGLSNIAGRARYLGGTLELESRPGRGTRLTVSLPAGRPQA